MFVKAFFHFCPCEDGQDMVLGAKGEESFDVFVVDSAYFVDIDNEAVGGFAHKELLEEHEEEEDADHLIGAFGLHLFVHVEVFLLAVAFGKFELEGKEVCELDGALSFDISAQ